MKQRPVGPIAAAWRKRKYSALKIIDIPDTALPGSLSMSYTRCGNPNCHCAHDQGHPAWSLTFMSDGVKRVIRIPHEWVEEVQRRVDTGRRLQDALREVLTANAELLALERAQRPRRTKPKPE
ncbi:MAG: hypothetical protein IH604_02450 [Burkholderiales bacterium]|nr:hypothetical protein [Burkholderiales bacterium]